MDYTEVQIRVLAGFKFLREELMMLFFHLQVILHLLLVQELELEDQLTVV